jgi:hypothetical protein
MASHDPAHRRVVSADVLRYRSHCAIARPDPVVSARPDPVVSGGIAFAEGKELTQQSNLRTGTRIADQDETAKPA